MSEHRASSWLRSAVRPWIPGCAGLLLLATLDAGAGVQALESTTTTQAGTYLNGAATGWQYQPDTKHAAGAAGLQVQANIGLAIPGASTSVTSTASLGFTDSEHGSLTYSWVNRADVPGGPNTPGSGGRVDAVFAPGSIYNSSGQVAAIATYAFIVGGSGNVDLSWSEALTDPSYSSGLNDFLLGRFHIPLATLDRFHEGQFAASVSVDPPSARSSGSVSLPFSALAGDTMVLRLLPNYGLSQDGGRVFSVLYDNLNVQFAVSAVSAVPEPPVAPLLLGGAALVAWASRKRRRRAAHP